MLHHLGPNRCSGLYPISGFSNVRSTHNAWVSSAQNGHFLVARRRAANELSTVTSTTSLVVILEGCNPTGCVLTGRIFKSSTPPVAPTPLHSTDHAAREGSNRLGDAIFQ